MVPVSLFCIPEKRRGIEGAVRKTAKGKRRREGEIDKLRAKRTSLQSSKASFNEQEVKFGEKLAGARELLKDEIAHIYRSWVLHEQFYIYPISAPLHSRQNISHQVYFAGFGQLQTQTTVTSLSIGRVQLTQGVHLTHWACGNVGYENHITLWEKLERFPRTRAITILRGVEVPYNFTTLP